MHARPFRMNCNSFLKQARTSHRMDLRQSSARLASRIAPRIGRYTHARQFQRKRKGLKKLKGYGPPRPRQTIAIKLQMQPESFVQAERSKMQSSPAAHLKQQPPSFLRVTSRKAPRSFIRIALVKTGLVRQKQGFAQVSSQPTKSSKNRSISRNRIVYTFP